MHQTLQSHYLMFKGLLNIFTIHVIILHINDEFYAF